MEYLRQSTASQLVTIGSFIDDTDFKSVEDGLTIANTDIKLKKNGATAGNKNSGGATSDVNGMYGLTFDATDTNTVGKLNLSVKVAGALVVWKDFIVLEEAVYDAFFAAAAEGMTTAMANKIADHFWRRTVANVEGATGPDAIPTPGRSAYNVLAEANNKFGVNGSKLETCKADDTTVTSRKTITSSASTDKITSVDTD